MKLMLLVASVLLCAACPAAARSFPTDNAAMRGGDCDPPVALVTTAQGDTVRACPGEIILLDGSASYPATGHTIQQWVWDLGNGMFDTTTTAFLYMGLPVSGYFVFGLQVIDEAGCTSLQEARLTAFVSRRAAFTGTVAPDTICAGSTVSVVGMAEQRPLIGPPAYDPASPEILADNLQFTYTFPIEVNGAAPNDTISNADQLGDICVSMEHSYMGDFVLSVTCPNGTTVSLHQQGGGNTFLGEPVDSDDTNPVPGICYTYCFNTYPAFGTWQACSIFGTTPNLIALGSAFTLAPGSYTSVDPLSELVGCPVNGTWILNCTDLWASDNGFLCSWSLGLSGFLPDSLNQYGPVLGTASPDSSFWSGMGVLNDALHAGMASYSPPGIGIEQLTYSVMDSYGCSYDTSLTIVAEPFAAPVIEANGSQGELCATNTFPATYTWYFEGSPATTTGNCWTPPGPGLVTVVGTNGFGCTDTSVYLVTAVDQLNESVQQLTAYPDGARGLWVEANGLTGSTVQLRISDMAGRLLWERSVHPSSGRLKERFSGSIATGTYILQLVDEGRMTALHVAVP